MSNSTEIIPNSTRGLFFAVFGYSIKEKYKRKRGIIMYSKKGTIEINGFEVLLPEESIIIQGGDKSKSNLWLDIMDYVFNLFGINNSNEN